MRANAYENLLALMVKYQDNPEVMKNLMVKAEILLSKQNDAAVLRELLNKELA